MCNVRRLVPNDKNGLTFAVGEEYGSSNVLQILGLIFIQLVTVPETEQPMRESRRKKRPMRESGRPNSQEEPLRESGKYKKE